MNSGSKVWAFNHILCYIISESSPTPSLIACLSLTSWFWKHFHIWVLTMPYEIDRIGIILSLNIYRRGNRWGGEINVKRYQNGLKFSNLKPLFILLYHTFRRCGLWRRISVPLILNSIAFWLNSFVRLQFPHLWHGKNTVFLSHWAVVMIKGNNACKPLAQCEACSRLFCCLLISWNRKWE